MAAPLYNVLFVWLYFNQWPHLTQSSFPTPHTGCKLISPLEGVANFGGNSICQTFKEIHNADYLHYLLLIKYSPWEFNRSFVHVQWDAAHNCKCIWAVSWENLSWGSRQGLIRTGLYNHRRWVEAWNFGFRKKSGCTIYMAKNKGAGQPLRLSLGICRKQVFSWRCSYDINDSRTHL